MNFTEYFHYLRLGGVTMAIIIATSILVLVIACERFLALYGLGAATRNLAHTIGRHLMRGELAAAQSAAARSTALAADLFRAAFERATRSTGDTLTATVDRERIHLALKMKRGLWVLATVGATAPFVGLFGTVVGIMRSFRDLGIDVEAGGTGGSAAVMAGISEALIATAAGIIVAVEAVVLYNIFQARLSRLNIELKLMAEELVELLREAAPNGKLPKLAESEPVSSATSGAS